jgi:hypothetical protein
MSTFTKYEVSTPDGSVTGTVTLVEDAKGDLTAIGEWSVVPGTPHPEETCKALQKDVLGTILPLHGD